MRAEADCPEPIGGGGGIFGLPCRSGIAGLRTEPPVVDQATGDGRALLDGSGRLHDDICVFRVHGVVDELLAMVVRGGETASDEDVLVEILRDVMGDQIEDDPRVEAFTHELHLRHAGSDPRPAR
jgi:hypothetical protein